MSMKKYCLMALFLCTVYLQGAENSKLPLIKLNSKKKSDPVYGSQNYEKDHIARVRSQSNGNERFIREENAGNFFQQKNKRLYSSTENM
jgi:hypothetical protein